LKARDMGWTTQEKQVSDTGREVREKSQLRQSRMENAGRAMEMARELKYLVFGGESRLDQKGKALKKKQH